MLLALLLACAASAEKQTDTAAPVCEEGTLTGHVQAGGLLLPDERVRAQSTELGTVETHTDGFGAFTLQLPFGDWTLRVDEGCYLGETSISVTDCVEQTVDIQTVYGCVG